MGITVAEERQLTVIKAFNTLNDNPGIYLGQGTYWGNDGKVCAVSLLAVAEKGITYAKRLKMSDHDGVAREIGVPRPYLSGLMDGFEGMRHRRGFTDSDDHSLGWLDGLCLRYAVEPNVVLDRAMQDFLRMGVLIEVEYDDEEADEPQGE